MLKLKNIRKSYQTADFVQVALNDASIAFRDNEFAAILGPSGSGKTTMLNIIGGLDQYDSGDLEIEGISTKKFKDHDWDTYRNNRIGFVFQSYNLIPHQTILSNVELALTLSGVSIAERRAKAKQALVDVGLGAHTHKKPNQLSGGQMQRVAIARALINDPEILLADEPTGALDTTTSTQVMDLLTEIAKDRLVIMVTHNSELAEEYANRIVHLKDGNIVSDSRPFDPNVDRVHTGREIRKSGMSFMTAIQLSFSNLMTKKWRTLVTSLAGSIGIIGIALILALANGINAYIRTVEEDTLSLYPLTIATTGFDLIGLMEGMGGGHSGDAPEREEGTVLERRVLENMFAMTSHNDLGALKLYLEASRNTIDPLVNSVHYMYDVTPQIFLSDTSDGPQQVNPDSVFAPLMGGGQDMNAMMGMGSFGGNVFHEMPGEIEMFEKQYDVVAGHWPARHDEAMLIISASSRISDMEMYSMGLRDREILQSMMDAIMHTEDADLSSDEELATFTYEELLAVEFRVVHSFEKYQYDEEFHVWVDRSGDERFMQRLVNDSMPLRIVGIARPSPTATATALPMGIHYTPDLIHHLMREAGASEIVQAQMRDRRVNVFTGRTFREEAENPDSAFDFARLITVDEAALEEAFAIDLEAFAFDFDMDGMEFDLDLDGLDIDFSGFNLDPNMFQFDLGSLGNLDMSSFADFSDLDFGDLDLNFDQIDVPSFEIGDMSDILNDIAGQLHIPTEALLGVMMHVLQDFAAELIADGITDPNEIMNAFMEYLTRPEVQDAISAQLAQIIADSDLQGQIADLVQEALEEMMVAYMGQVMEAVQAEIGAQIQQAMEHLMSQVMARAMTAITEQIRTLLADQMGQAMGRFGNQMEAMMGEMIEEIAGGIGGQMENLMGEIANQMEDAMAGLAEQFENFDPEALVDAFQIEMGEEEILQLMMAMMSPTENSYERNLSLLGYADLAIPSQINIYPQNFDAKQDILDILDNYNERMEAEGYPEKVVQYTDLVGAMMSSVTDIINMVSYALIAFVAISLVVSSIMIGVITYISVLERKKEIGILRAIGASKSNIRRVFNAETLIVGFVAGVLGVFITLVVAEIANVIVLQNFDIVRIARLPAVAVVVLIGTSMFLTFIAGLFPSSAAARKDPIEALRSE
ncbi:MAG: ATP-binding cassette domain-containing protein [Lachnospiraceae bacterium]|nr:ATP-binding cassette domain-containing protein [Lachnospiraceae bacterium]